MTPLLILLGILGGQPDTSSLFQAERAFAARSLSHGIDSAFLFALAPDGVLFRSGPVNGPKWIRDHPGRPTARLAWEPSAGAVSASGDMGITAGPWTFTDAAKPDSPPYYGHFVTVWKRNDRQGEWKVAVDIGISHPLRSADALRGRFDQRPWGHARAGGNAAPSGDVLLDADKEVLLAIDRAGTRKPFLDRLASDAVVFRNGEPPMRDREKIRKAIEDAMAPFAWRPLSAGIAASGDLGFTYGSYTVGNEKGSYLRIWRLSQEGVWVILVDLTDPDA